MCAECGCGQGTTRIQFTAKGYTEENAKETERELLGLAGVMYVHIHSHDGATTIDYDPKKTKLSGILNVFETRGIEAEL